MVFFTQNMSIDGEYLENRASDRPTSPGFASALVAIFSG
jgi:hypothetical protein